MKRHKASQKCQSLHNLYILALNEFNDFNKMTKEKIFPSLMNCNKKIAENIATEL
jgi:hypothetical protein